MEKLVVVKAQGSNPDRQWPLLAGYGGLIDIEWVDAARTPLRSVNAEIDAMAKAVDAIKANIAQGMHLAASGSDATALIAAVEDLIRDGAPTPASITLVNPQRFTRARPFWAAESVLAWREENRDVRAEASYELSVGQNDPGRAAITEIETIVSRQFPNGGYGVPKTWSPLTNAYADIPTLVLQTPRPPQVPVSMFTETAEAMQRSGAILRDLVSPSAVGGSIVAWLVQLGALTKLGESLAASGWMVEPMGEPRYLASPDWAAEHSDGRRLELLNRGKGEVGVGARKARGDAWFEDATAYFEPSADGALVDRTAVRAAAEFPDGALVRDLSVILTPGELAAVTEMIVDVARVGQNIEA
ncbi:hypothetical protein GCM10025867_50020 (plasmid) [Frondihabitans sucicola]|uniref:Uncharacterized protein n=1 Tax=Frondihabitans sucicola TaxID=1268041 RepID=A0ABN6Y6W0_9MICO|nr:hypothetical protein [Frondihabitans sucicola]BDZ52761.1 hypothetical protein GCM10025867_50020 [Frondihabitans sucicola]